MAAEDRDRFRHQRRAGRRKGCDPQTPRPDAEDGGQRVLGRAHLGEDRLGVLDERRPGCGGAHATPVAHHERRPGLGLEPRDRL